MQSSVNETSEAPARILGSCTALENGLPDDKELYGRLLRNSAVPTFVINTQHRVIIWNRACEMLTGITEAEILGTDNHWRAFYKQQRPTLADLVLGDNPEEISSLYSIHRASDLLAEGLQAEGWYAALGGKTRYIFFDAAPIHNRDGRLVAAIETLQDITDRKLAERQLLKSRAELMVKHEQLKNLFQVVDGVKEEWVKTMNCLGDIIIVTNDSGQITQCNRAMQELVNLPYTEIVGKPWIDLLCVPQLLPDSVCPRATEFFHHSSGRWFDVNFYSSREAQERETSGMVITFHDSTEIRRVHSELEKAYAKLKSTHSQMLQSEKMASIGQLAAGVAHEVNNPVGYISSNLVTLAKYVERLKEFVAMQSDVIDGGGEKRCELAEARRRLKIDYIMDDIGQLIAESADGADRVRNIVQDLKSFSRVDEAECKPANLIECLETTIKIVWNELKYKATLRKDFNEIPLTMCHPQQLNQVFMNLLVNSAQAIESRGEIRVACRHENGSILVSISDTGVGIPHEIMHRLFEPFFTTKEVGEGTGLGLSISYDIVKRHNGDITVESAIGQGSTFTVRIPVVEEGEGVGV